MDAFERLGSNCRLRNCSSWKDHRPLSPEDRKGKWVGMLRKPVIELPMQPKIAKALEPPNEESLGAADISLKQWRHCALD